jgi:hypothetical protein
MLPDFSPKITKGEIEGVIWIQYSVVGELEDTGTGGSNPKWIGLKRENFTLAGPDPSFTPPRRRTVFPLCRTADGKPLALWAILVRPPLRELNDIGHQFTVRFTLRQQRGSKDNLLPSAVRLGALELVFQTSDQSVGDAPMKNDSSEALEVRFLPRGGLSGQPQQLDLTAWLGRPVIAQADFRIEVIAVRVGGQDPLPGEAWSEQFETPGKHSR